jgi:hypothetical protein
MQNENKSMNVVLSYINALDKLDYKAAASYLSDSIRIRGPSGESFSNPGEFVGLLSQYRGRYDVKKIFADEGDVCLLYDLVTTSATVFMCSWYQVREAKITSIHTVFDPRAFAPLASK